jgi:hypothetical protein
MTPQARQGPIVYCIARAGALADGARIRARGLADSGLRIIPYREIAAVVGDADQEHYQVSRRNVRAHEEVIEEIMHGSDVVPLRFGEVAPNDQEVRRLLLEDQYEGLVQRLDRLHDRVELALRVSFDEPRLFEELRSMDADLVDAGRRAVSYEDRVTLGQNVAQMIDRKRRLAADELLEELRPLAAEVVIGEPTTDLMILNAAFLVDRSRLEGFDDRVHALGERAAGRLQFKYVGPLPPYSFVDLHIPEEAGPEEAGPEAQHA